MSLYLTGVILAGGESRRMGRDKALLDWGGRPMVEAIARELRSVCREVVIVADEVDSHYRSVADRCVRDLFPGAGVLGGIHAGLTATPGDLAAVVGCDMPFVNPRVLERFALAAEEWNAVVLRRGAYVEPLHAVYRRDGLSVIEAALRSREFAVHRVLKRLGTRTLDAEEIADLDPELRCFRNVNTLDEWQRARRDAGLEPGTNAES